jgi:hypothetical protein
MGKAWSYSVTNSELLNMYFGDLRAEKQNLIEIRDNPYAYWLPSDTGFRDSIYENLSHGSNFLKLTLGIGRWAFCFRCWAFGLRGFLPVSFEEKAAHPEWKAGWSAA